ncbi:hypothetical protein [Halobacteriovorax sp. JY17]|uniref:hypothetical protein n=1 Tax=Halobacteriovorax sp. JY17 TaxID=2014617 RepID=UPI000C4529E3|nr:hypothetical protein [Halobacteriovorax sp. JY17]PIK15675.1 MAG: hypothetical protein CES88_02815 [Halobacteriovorax sp. JY17]
MRLLIYLGTLAIMLMAFEVKASWQEFEQAQIDISPWLYEEATEFSDWEEYITLGNGRSQSIKVDEKSLSSNGTVVAITQRITNISNTPYCVIAKLKQSTNTINTYLRGGRTIVSPEETILIGGYRVHTLGKNWKVNWSFQATKKLENCK